MKFFDYINNSKLNKRMNEKFDRSPFRFLGIFIFFSCLLLTVLDNSNNNWAEIGIFIGLILFLLTYLWSWIIGLSILEIYFFNKFIDKLNHSLFGDALITAIIIFYVFVFIKFLFSFRNIKEYSTDDN